MVHELQIINHWINSGEPSFLSRNGLSAKMFIGARHIIDWINDYKEQYGALPSYMTLAGEFEDFVKYESLDSIEFLKKELTNNLLYVEFKPLLMESASKMSADDVLGAIHTMKQGIESIQKNTHSNLTKHDWVKDAEKRYELYMEKHGKDGLGGIPTGIRELDEITGGWKPDDFILVSARLNQGKSLVGNYIGYHAWDTMMKSNVENPVLHISTEMPSLEVSYRLDTLKSHFSNRALSEGKLSDPSLYKEYLADLSKKATSYIILTEDDNGGRQFTPDDIETLIYEHKPSFVIVDQLYDLSDGSNERDIRKKIVNCTRDLRRINLITQTPMLVIAQSGRESAKMARKDPNATPELDQIQESDAPAQKATKVLTLRMLGKDVIKLSLKKNRGGEKDRDMFMRVNIDTGIWDSVNEAEMVF